MPLLKCPPRRGHAVLRCGRTPVAEQECAAFNKKSGRIIKLITIQEILDEQHVQKM